MSSNFNFYVNRQGVQGKRGAKGEQGFSPVISVESQTANEYILKVENEDGSFTTPNLRGNAIENNGGTYIRFNPETEQMYTGFADGATTEQAGVVRMGTYEDLEAGESEELVPSVADVHDYVLNNIGTSGFVTTEQFNTYTSNTAITLDNLSNNKLDSSLFNSYASTTDSTLESLSTNKVDVSDYTTFTNNTNSALSDLSTNKLNVSVFDSFANSTSSALDTLDTEKLDFTDLASSLIEGSNVTLTKDNVNKTITISSSGEAQVQADWTETDSADPSFIQNKPTLGTMASEDASDYTPSAGLSDVAISGSYNDLLNKPTIPAAQVNSDWNATSGVSQILNKPTLFSGDYNDLINKPTIPSGVIVDSTLSTTSENPVQNNVITTELNKKIEGITSSDVTSALGYTPYNATNPAGYITGSELPDTSSLSYYGTCETAGITQEKVVACEGFELKEGASIRVKFTNAQSYNGGVRLNVNSTGAILVKSVGTTNSVRYNWLAGEVVSFTYDGTNWIMEDAGIASTTYYGYTKLMTSVTSTSDTVALTPESLNNLVQNMIEPYPIYSDSNTYAVGDRVRYSYNAWECTTAITTAEDWTAVHWKVLDPIQTQIDNITSNQVISVNNITPVNGNVTLTIPDTSNLANKDLSNLSNTGNAKFQAPLVSGTNIKTLNGNSILGSGDLTLDGLPSQTGQSGKFLGTDGTNASWSNLPVAAASSLGVVQPDGSTTQVTNGVISTVNTVQSTTVNNIVKITQADYDALATKDPNTQYIITDAPSLALADLSNITDTGYIKMAGASMPSGRYVNLTLGADGATYTAPSDGWVIVTGQGSNTSITIRQGNNSVYNTAGNSGDYYTVILPVRKGNFNVGYRGITLVSFRFIYAQGSESEAS